MNEKKIPAIRIEQPYGSFYLVNLDYKFLLNTCFINQAEEYGDNIIGIQRKDSTARVKEIAKFIDSEEAAFPNTIILSANYDKNDFLIAEEDRWYFEEVDGSNNLYSLIVPNDKIKACSIIDGQHRLLGFNYSERKNFNLACAIYDSLPPSGQATLFSTINFNQRKVDKSLAYQLFGYSLDKIDRKEWSPDLLAVYFSRKFNLDEKSPFYNKLKYRVIDEQRDKDWSISSSAFIDGVLSLISKKPKDDRYLINSSFTEGKKVRERLLKTNDDSPLRTFFIETNDLAIEQILNQFFALVKDRFWTDALIEKNIILAKTIGILALFDILKKCLVQARNIDKTIFKTFEDILNKVEPEEFIDKSEDYPPTSKGRKSVVEKFMGKTE